MARYTHDELNEAVTFAIGFIQALSARDEAGLQSKCTAELVAGLGGSAGLSDAIKTYWDARRVAIAAPRTITVVVTDDGGVRVTPGGLPVELVRVGDSWLVSGLEARDRPVEMMTSIDLDADDHILHEVTTEAVASPVRAAAAHALQTASADHGPEAMPPDGRVRWFVPQALAERWRPHLTGRGIRVPRDRAEQSLQGYCTDDGELWIRVDDMHGTGAPAAPGEVAQITAHEAVHRFHFLGRGRSTPPDPDDEREAGNYGLRYWLLHWVPGGADVVAKMDETREKPEQPPDP